MKLRSIILFLILFSSTMIISVSGQENTSKKIKIFITGAVYDSETKEPLSDTHFTIHKSENYSTHSNGKFSFFGNPGDTISYRYIGYKEMKVIIPDYIERDGVPDGCFYAKRYHSNT